LVSSPRQPVPDRPAKPYAVVLRKSAVRELSKLPKAAQQRIADEINGLALNPRPHGVQKLAGSGELYRVRVGDYRVVYSIADRQLIVEIIRVRHRKDVYRDG
jgi:mRNA interferase RelE/StbE